ncbi:hypothetical protein OZX74_04720 [Bifidobacterium sp. ESL0798]|uniref:hypothetical protein n=1 Tax=Bifidobacterium sp. ESL0798 TaxID=2983235 RepID=UPI0023F9C0B7|nr:hypothetical protein [Bifidobacterium sp. ESL0798]WEV74810.1 hypothetical protein OZX74_04720 [Bifidobacterium sp. ESL0798]
MVDFDFCRMGFPLTRFIVNAQGIVVTNYQELPGLWFVLDIIIGLVLIILVLIIVVTALLCVPGFLIDRTVNYDKKTEPDTVELLRNRQTLKDDQYFTYWVWQRRKRKLLETWLGDNLTGLRPEGRDLFGFDSGRFAHSHGIGFRIPYRRYVWCEYNGSNKYNVAKDRFRQSSDQR